MTARTTRRGLLGGCTAGALLLGAPGAAAAESDNALLALADKLEQCQAAITKIDESGRDDDWPDLDELQDKFWRLADEVRDTPARTPQGIQAKAKVTRIVWKACGAGSRGEPDNHLISLLDDMLGEG